jgi:uncharacterized cofD-like protein
VFPTVGDYNFLVMVNKEIVVIGGGTGIHNLLIGLKKHTNQITAIVTAMDSGGSSGILRDQFGHLPPGDVRQCLVALSPDQKAFITLRKLFSYRFDKGQGLEGHTFGNLFLTALTEIEGDPEKAIEAAGKILGIKGQVVPVTLEHAHLVAKLEDGTTIRGENEIDVPKHDGKLRITDLSLEPKAKVNPKALEAIKNADIIVIGPGDLYTSLIANLTVDGVSEAIRDSKAKKVFVVNLMTKFGQTYKFKASDFVTEIEKYLEGNVLDYVLINTAKLPEDIVDLYEEENDYPVEDDLKDDHPEVVRVDLLSPLAYEKVQGDSLRRSLIRHDSSKMADAILELS